MRNQKTWTVGALAAAMVLSGACGEGTTLVPSGGGDGPRKPVEEEQQTTRPPKREIRLGGRTWEVDWTPTQDPGPGDDEQGPGTDPQNPGPRRADLRLRGANGAALGVAHVTVAEVKVWADGQPVNVDLGDAQLDLGDENHAWRIASLTVPEGAAELQVMVRFDERGSWQNATGAGELDLRGRPLIYEAPVNLIARKDKAVVEFDLERSLELVEAGRYMVLPHYRLEY